MTLKLIDATILRLIDEANGNILLINDIAAKTYQSRITISRHINQLIRDGYIEKTGRRYNITPKAYPYLE